MKFLTFTDVHASAINPESRVDDYLADILAKLAQIGQAGRKLGVDFYILAGDLFNLKYPLRNPHNLNRALIDMFKGYGAPVYATEGNHDLRNDSYETFNEQPLSVLYASGALHQIRDERVVCYDGVEVHLRGFPFVEDPDIELMPKAPRESDYSISVLHLYSSLGGGTLHGTKVYSYPEIAALGDDMFVMGHYHIDQGITSIQHEGRKVTFVNVGAVSRGSLVEDNLDRIPRIGYVEVTRDGDTVRVDTKSVRLKVKPSSEIFDLEAKREEKKKMDEAEAFVERLRVEESEEPGEERLEAALTSLDVDKVVLESVRHYLEEADITLKEMS